MTGISIFDVDRTLTLRPTYTLFLLGAAWRSAPWRLAFSPIIALVAIPYALRLLPRRRMKEAMHALLLGHRLSRGRAEALARAFSDRLARAGLYPEGVALIAAERAAGRRVMLATAAPAFYIAPLAAELGITDIIATASVWDGEHLTARIGGENCYGASKRDMIGAHLAAVGIDRDCAHVRFYSDHLSDLPTFEWSDEPIAVNPSPSLLAAARARGWTILDWKARRAEASAE
jgi:HAD superfamily phosphoserine phosphatase-like hydrolase